MKLNTIYRSISVFFSNALDFMQTEPVIRFSDFTQTDDKFVILLRNFGDFDKHGTLGLGDSENPVFALVVVYLDFEAAV